MARLIVEAVSRQPRDSDDPLEVFASVSRADNGLAVTGLTQANFRLCHWLGGTNTFTIELRSEAEWEPSDTVSSGCYRLSIFIQREDGRTMQNWEVDQLEKYSFGLRVRKAKEAPEQEGPFGQAGQMAQFDQGQTIIRFEKFSE